MEFKPTFPVFASEYHSTGVPLPTNHRKKWTEVDFALLKQEISNNTPFEEIFPKLQRTPFSVFMELRKLGEDTKYNETPIFKYFYSEMEKYSSRIYSIDVANEFLLKVEKLGYSISEGETVISEEIRYKLFLQKASKKGIVGYCKGALNLDPRKRGIIKFHYRTSGGGRDEELENLVKSYGGKINSVTIRIPMKLVEPLPEDAPQKEVKDECPLEN